MTILQKYSQFVVRFCKTTKKSSKTNSAAYLQKVHKTDFYFPQTI